jgi:hypothetical protein
VQIRERVVRWTTLVVRRPIRIGEVAVAGVLIDAPAAARPYEGCRRQRDRRELIRINTERRHQTEGALPQAFARVWLHESADKRGSDSSTRR